MNAKSYRQFLHQERQHPQSLESTRRPVGALYGSMLAFVVFEGFTEAYSNIPSGLVFPTGFLLFWAFYYTYLQPNRWEMLNRSKREWSVTELPALVITLGIAGVKSLLMLTSHLLHRLLYEKPKGRIEQKPRMNARPSPPPPKASAPSFSPEALRAFQDMDLAPTENWLLVQKRYRELAKKFHPDLNQENTIAGRRFVKIDLAYRRLEKLRRTK